MKDIYVDTSVFVIAAGAGHPDRESCRAILQKSSTGSGPRLNTSVESVQEFLFHRMRRSDRAASLAAARAVAQGCVLHPFDEDVLVESLRLVEATPVRGRTAVHAATALLNSLAMLTLDTDFQGIPGLDCIHPRDFEPDPNG